MQNVTKIRWKYRELIDALGGPRSIVDHIAARGVVPPSRNTIKGWQTRNTIPSAWVPLLIIIGEEVGVLKTVRGLWAGVGE